MSWNKYNLYNLAKFRPHVIHDTSLRNKKLYAQQIASKRVTRKYHGQSLPERVFKKQLYSPKFNVVAGGEGNKRLLWGGLYQGIERRLDTVIFRSLFATSVQQAKQMVIHGHVEVNGKKVCAHGLKVNIRKLDQDYYYDPEISTILLLS